MHKQPYRLKSAFFSKFLIIVSASLLAACGQEEASETSGTATSLNAPQTRYVSDIIPAPAEDAGFLNYDIVIGDPNAPVEIIEYASYSCAGCATFHRNVVPQIKSELIDTGKAKFVVRSVISNDLDSNISKAVRCVNEQRSKALSDAYLDKQDQWLNRAEQQRLAGLYDGQTANQRFFDFANAEIVKIAALAGLNRARIEECYNNAALQEYLFKVQSEGDQKYRIEVTPTVIVNGNKVNSNFRAIERAVEAVLN